MVSLNLLRGGLIAGRSNGGIQPDKELAGFQNAEYDLTTWLPEVDLVDSPLSGRECEPFAVSDGDPAVHPVRLRLWPLAISHRLRAAICPLSSLSRASV
jgi:hypothetical protein